MPTYLKETQVTEMLNISVKSLRPWRLTGRGPVFTKLNSMVRYRLADVIAFADAGRRTNTAGGVPETTAR